MVTVLAVLRPKSFVWLLSLAVIAGLWSTSSAHAEDFARGVPYVTLRDRLEETDRGVVYGDDRSTLKAGHCILEQTNLDFLSQAAKLAPFYVPEEILRVDTVREKPLATVLGELGAAPVLYVHGYYIDFDKGCRRATLLKEGAGLDQRFLWFSWPSDGTLLNYAHDEVNLFWSVSEIVRLIIEMHDLSGDQTLNLAGHSLGARGVVLALHEISWTRPDIKLDNVVLLAPDMDFEIFTKLLSRIQKVSNRISLYTSDADRALSVSSQLHGYPRLGQSGNDIAALKGLEVIDTSDLPTMSPNGHLYHIHNEEVGRDLDQLFNLGLPASERRGLVQVGPNLWQLQP